MAFALSVRALSGGATLEVDGADTIATVKKKFDAALVEIGQEPMKGLSLWHENARLDESRTLQSYGVGAGAAIQALATEHDVEASGMYLNVHVGDGAKIKVARRLPRPSARRRGTG